MWVTTPTTQSFLPPLISFNPFSKLPPPSTTTTTATTFSTLQLRYRNPHPPLITAFASSGDTGGLGQAVFSALDSSPNQNKKAQPNELSGSDILQALQKASARKANTKKQKQNNKKWSNEVNRKTNNNNNERKGVEFEKVRPITIKSDWVTRIADLEKRLQQFDAH